MGRRAALGTVSTQEPGAKPVVNPGQPKCLLACRTRK